MVQRLNAVSEKSGALEDADKQRKVSHQKIFILQIWHRFHRKIVHNQVSEVYEFMKKLEPLFSVLPTVVDRLLSLKTLHEEGKILNPMTFLCFGLKMKNVLQPSTSTSH